MFKKILVAFLITCIVFSATGCSALNLKTEEKVFDIENYKLQITADSTFSEETGGEFDLQITNGDCYISIMAYKQIDISDELTPLDVFDMQNEDLFSRRTAVRVIEEAKTQNLSQKILLRHYILPKKTVLKTIMPHI